MLHSIRFLFAPLVALLAIPSLPTAQTSPALATTPEAFASENAILDTSVLFAIGAREARQALRGSFGWPSFQEGLVEGVYFRFDPDGYARFAPTPRLDTDVFEVICRSRTYSCVGRKGGLEIFLSDRGQLQLKIENVLSGDTFFVSEGISEIQIPERILQPLDVQLEMLLASASELVVRRGGNDVAQVSLKGFVAVSSYLRWIAARQDYSVLPRGWPVPNGNPAQNPAGMTQSVAWSSPMPQPQVLAPAIAPIMAPSAHAAAPLNAATTDGNSDSLRAELEILRRMILEQSAPNEVVAPTSAIVAPPLQKEVPLQELLATINGLQSEIARLRNAEASMVAVQPPVMPVVAPAALMPPVQDDISEQVNAPAKSAPQNLQFLMEELGLDMQTAVAILQMAPQSQTAAGLGVVGLPIQIAPSVMAAEPQAVATSVLYQNDVVDQILAELEAEMVPAAAQSAAPAINAAPMVSVAVKDYQLLSRYFASAALPALQAMAADQ